MHCVDPKFSHADILSTMIGLISIAKPDYDIIEIFHEKQDFFSKAPAIPQIQTSAGLFTTLDIVL